MNFDLEEQLVRSGSTDGGRQRSSTLLEASIVEKDMVRVVYL